jgi:hypothetical protein
MKLTEAAKIKDRGRYVRKITYKLINDFDHMWEKGYRKIGWEIGSVIQYAGDSLGVEVEDLGNIQVKKLAMAALQDMAGHHIVYKKDPERQQAFSELVKRYYNDIKSGKLRL